MRLELLHLRLDTRKLLFLIAICCWIGISPQSTLAEEVWPVLLEGRTTRTDPFRYIGEVHTASFYGTGTVVAKKGVLTAAHVLFEMGFNSHITFLRGKYYHRVLSAKRPSYMAIFAGYRHSVSKYGENSGAAFSHDLGLLSFATNVADGGFARCLSSPDSILGNKLKVGVGYGSEFDFGFPDDAPSYIATRAKAAAEGGGYYIFNGVGIEPGMSGGPVFTTLNGQPFLIAVLVSGTQPSRISSPSTGVRIFSPVALEFIRNNL